MDGFDIIHIKPFYLLVGATVRSHMGIFSVLMWRAHVGVRNVREGSKADEPTERTTTSTPRRIMQGRSSLKQNLRAPIIGVVIDVE